MLKSRQKPPSLPKDPFAYIGFWQLMTFVMLLLLVWLNELRDVTSFFFGVIADSPNYFRGFILTAAVLFTAIITIGNTYLQQKRVFHSLLSICSKCHKIRIKNEQWQRIEEYFKETTLLHFSHGLCPECKNELMHTIKNQSDIKQGETKDDLQ